MSDSKGTETNPIKVMLVDDQKMTRLGFAMMLQKDKGITIIAQAGNGQEALDILSASNGDLPDVILMDVRMPVLDGIEATGRISEEYPSCKVLVLTTYDEDSYAFGGIDMGAVGFLLKDVNAEQLKSDIRSIYHGGSVLTPRITKLMVDRHTDHTLSDKTRQALQAQFARLSPRELETAFLISESKTNQEIADDLTMEVASVRRNVSRILSKLGLRDRTQIAVNWYKAGMTMSDRP
jgi:DNA-binding NarL/FixJ family response regulator